MQTVSERADSLAYWMGQMEAVYQRDAGTGLGYGEEALRLLAREPDPIAEMQVLYWMGEMHFYLGSYDPAIDKAEQVLAVAVSQHDLARQADAEALKAEVMVRKAWYFSVETDYAPGRALAEQARRRYDVLGDTIGIARSLRTIARAERLEGRFEDARTTGQLAVTLSRAVGDAESIALSLERLGNVYRFQGEPRQAIPYTEEALSIAEFIGNKPMEAQILASLWREYMEVGDHESALVYIGRELAIREGFGDKHGTAWVLHDAGELKESDQDFSGAVESVNASLALWKELESPWEIARNLDYLSHLLALRAAELGADGAYEQAVATYKQYVRTMEQLMTAESLEKVAEMREQYDTWDRQEQILLLENARQIQRLWVSGLVIGLGMLGLIAFLVYGRYRTTNAARKELAQAYADLQNTHDQQKKTRAEVDQMKARFFANISHEFRTPLTLILGQIDSVAAHSSGKDLERLRMAARNSEHLKRLINQLLDLSKLEAGGMRLETRPTDLVPFLRSIFFSFESQAARKQITQRLTSTHDHVMLAFDEEKFEQVFNNLFSNAFKFTPEGGMVELAITYTPAVHPPAVTICVRDTGIGIVAENIPYVFDRFYQVGTSSTREYEGTGIGLALTKELVNLHGGTITVTSEEGMGTSFEICMPVDPTLVVLNEGRVVDESGVLTFSANDPVATDATSVADDGLDSKEVPVEDQLSVLIVEDNADVRSYLRDHLADTYLVLEAFDGEQGVHLAQEVIPDLIITDVMMPRTDGYELCRVLRTDTRTSHIPIIMLTARASQEDKLEGLETGVDDYLIKPFSPRELQVRVRNLITLRRQLRDRFRTATVIKPSDIETTSIDQVFLQQVIREIETHYDDTSFSADALADAVHMSVSQLNRKLNALIGQTAGRLQRSMRLQRGADMLAQGAGTVSEVAYAVGFSNAAHFATVFKKQFGTSPSTYRQE